MAARVRPFRSRRVPRGPDRVRRGLRRLRSQRRRPGRRRRSAVRGDAAQRQARSGARHRPTPTTTTSPLFVQDDWRIRPDLTLNVGPALRARHRRQEHQPRRRDQPDRAAVPAGRAQERLEQLRPADRLQLGARRAAARACTAATASTTTASRSRSSRSSAAWTAGRCRSRCAPATSSSSIRDRPVPAVRAVDGQSVHRVHPARRRRVRHQHHRQQAAEPDGCSSSTSASSSELPRQHRAARRRRPQPRHAFHHRPDDRRGVQPGRRRARSRRQSRIERQHALRRAARQRRAPRGALRVPRVVHARQGARTTPTTTRFRSPTDRSIRTICAASSDRRRTISATASRLPAGSQVPAGIRRGAAVDAGVGRADGHPDAGWRSPACRPSSAMPAAASSRRPPS